MLYTISNHNYTVSVSSIGAELKSIKDLSGKEYIWQGDSAHWGKSAPILFPIVGHLYEDKTIINGQEYLMKIHGFLQRQEFTVLDQKESEISLVSIYNEETLKEYPFKYKVIITYRLIHDKLRVNFNVTNEGEDKMPFNIGGHPGFNLPMFEGDTFTDYSVHFEKEENFLSPFITTRGTLDFSKGTEFKSLKELKLSRSLFDIDTVVIPSVNSHKVKLLNKKNHGIEFSFPDFPSFAIWSPHKTEAPFVCLEPWVGYGDRDDTSFIYEDKDNIVKLESFETYNIYFEIKVI